LNWQIKILIVVLVLVLLGLQYRLWVGEGSIAEVRGLKRQLAEQETALLELKQRNEVLSAEIQSLKEDDAAVEARARSELGMIRKGETYFQLIRPGENQGD
jgi:cell division protein FtsB